ncbi:ribonuclease Oy-like [Ornithodoros turicata]|uniref:ribonuclease Oy-like n=1 Tax=Ornithodoros turicata TaxID=34597 RepID=UPI003138DFF6
MSKGPGALLLLSILATWYSCDAIQIHPRQPKPGRPFEHIAMRITWPSGFCMVEPRCDKVKVQNIGNEWTLHGIWPAWSRGFPTDCDDSVKFEIAQVENISPQLSLRWPSLTGNDKTFWQHEWKKHGTCALHDERLGGISKYFQGGLDALNRYNISHILSQRGVIPGASYMYRDIETALQEGFNGSVTVICRPSKSESKILYEVQLHLEKGSLDPKTLPRHVTNKGCGSQASVTYR